MPAPPVRRRFIGLMSGTSLDGVDCVLAEEDEQGRWRTLDALTHPYPRGLRHHLHTLAHAKRVDLEACLRHEKALTECYAQAVHDLLARTRCPVESITAIGCHGQTIRHRPQAGFTWQMGDGARLAVHTGIPVVSDFRRADVAAGGQGAPLAPLFHRALLWRGEEELVIVNIGGMANLSRLTPEDTLGFDSGPGNVLLDAWAQRHLGRPLDENGAFATSGRVVPALLQRLLDHPYLQRPPPKSTGREAFHLSWLTQQLAHLPPLPPEDVQATLCEFTAVTIAKAIEEHAPRRGPVLLCGGGVHNRHLVARLRARLAPRPVTDTSERGVDPDYLEALGFAWLAARRWDQKAVDTPAVTGARHPVVPGAVYLPGV